MSTLYVDNLQPNLGSQVEIPNLKPIAGSVVQTVNLVSDTWYTTTSNSFVDVTGLSASITPTYATSKILVNVQLSLGAGNYSMNLWRMVRDSTVIGVGTGGTDAVTGGFYTETGSNNQYSYSNTGTTYLDSPNTTSAVTYKIQIKNTNSGVSIAVNKRTGDSLLGSISTITLQEIAQ